MALLDIADLSVDFPTRQGVLHAVDGVSLSLEAGEVLGIRLLAITMKERTGP